MPRARVRGQSPSQEGWPVGLSLSQCGHFFANSIRYIVAEMKANALDRYFVTFSVFS